MFRENLLESSPLVAHRNRWPMATAFIIEASMAAVLIVVPFASSTALSVAARVPPIFPIVTARVKQPPTSRNTTCSMPCNVGGRLVDVVPLTSNNSFFDFKERARDDDHEVGPPILDLPSDNSPARQIGDSMRRGTDLRPTRLMVSNLDPAQLLHRVEPVFPHIAVVTGISGEVKLHAIISRQGTIESLDVISGHPLLVKAATDAVLQWRYRPYYLNQEPVEVETFITVNFRRGG